MKENKLTELSMECSLKKYSPRAAKPLAIISLACGAGFLTGIALLFFKVENIGLPIGLMLGSGLLGIILLSCFVAEKSRTLILDADKIIFPRGVMINGKMAFQKTAIELRHIQSIERCLYKGDGLISKDTYFYTLTLDDHRNLTVTLYAYGKDAEKEILELISPNRKNTFKSKKGGIQK